MQNLQETQIHTHKHRFHNNHNTSEVNMINMINMVQATLTMHIQHAYTHESSAATTLECPWSVLVIEQHIKQRNIINKKLKVCTMVNTKT